MQNQSKTYSTFLGQAREVIYLGTFGVLKIIYLIMKVQWPRFHFNFEKRCFFNTFQTILNKIIPYFWTPD